MFIHVSMEPSEYYSILLFKDMYNYGGIKESDPEKIFSRWDIALHLPTITQKRF